jgi:hypothetical protein
VDSGLEGGITSPANRNERKIPAHRRISTAPDGEQRRQSRLQTALQGRTTMAEQASTWTITVRYVPSDTWLALTGISPSSTVRRLKQHALDTLRLASSSNPTSFATSDNHNLPSSPVLRPATAGGVSSGNNGNAESVEPGTSWGRNNGLKAFVSRSLSFLPSPLLTSQ